MWGGQWSDFERTLAELYEISPVSPEDYLFKGQALARYDSEAAEKMLNEAVRRLPTSGIARILRAEARVVLAIGTGNPKFADDALDDVRLAKQLLRDNPAVLARSVHVHVAAANVYKRANGNTEKILQYLEQAKRDAVSLERFPTLLSVQAARAQYFEYVNDYDAAAEAWSRVISHGNVGYWASHFAAVMVQRGKSPEALEALEKIEPPHSPSLDLALAYLYLLVDYTEGKNRALAVYEELETREILGLSRILVQTIPLLLGRKEEVKQASKERQPVPPPSRSEADFQDACWQYLVGDASSDELLEGAGSSKYRECIAHYIIAMNMLADGRRDLARDHFEQAEKTGVFRASYNRWGLAFLARMEADPNWPPWIPMQQTAREDVEVQAEKTPGEQD